LECLSIIHIKILFVKRESKIFLLPKRRFCSKMTIVAFDKAALVGEPAVPCTCNPLQQGRIPDRGCAMCRLTPVSSVEDPVLRNADP